MLGNGVLEKEKKIAGITTEKIDAVSKGAYANPNNGNLSTGASFGSKVTPARQEKPAVSAKCTHRYGSMATKEKLCGTPILVVEAL